jgi:DNA-binding NarL/FixJ family response regulator
VPADQLERSTGVSRNGRPGPPPTGGRSGQRSVGEGKLVALQGRVPRAEAANRPRIVVFSDRDVIAEGLVGLLPEEWQGSAAIATDTAELAFEARGGLTAAIIDVGTPDSAAAATLTRAHGASVVLMLPRLDQELDPDRLEQADAIVVRDDVEPLTLRVAVAAGRLGMRLLPRDLPLPPGQQPHPAPAPEALRLGEPAQQALALLADGLRDAEIARELNLSESAVRKLIQRTVRRVGARTRCQAIAAAVRDGQLA